MRSINISPGYKVEHRVTIALDSLNAAEQKTLRGIIADRTNFLKRINSASRVRKISNDRPLFSVKAPGRLNFIYSQSGDEIVVMDVMHETTLNQFVGKKVKSTKQPTKTAATAVRKKTVE